MAIPSSTTTARRPLQPRSNLPTRIAINPSSTFDKPTKSSTTKARPSLNYTLTNAVHKPVAGSKDVSSGIPILKAPPMIRTRKALAVGQLSSQPSVCGAAKRPINAKSTSVALSSKLDPKYKLVASKLPKVRSKTKRTLGRLFTDNGSLDVLEKLLKMVDHRDYNSLLRLCKNTNHAFVESSSLQLLLRQYLHGTIYTPCFPVAEPQTSADKLVNYIEHQRRTGTFNVESGKVVDQDRNHLCPVALENGIMLYKTNSLIHAVLGSGYDCWTVVDLASDRTESGDGAARQSIQTTRSHIPFDAIAMCVQDNVVIVADTTVLDDDVIVTLHFSLLQTNVASSSKTRPNQPKRLQNAREVQHPDARYNELVTAKKVAKSGFGDLKLSAWPGGLVGLYTGGEVYAIDWKEGRQLARISSTASVNITSFCFINNSILATSSLRVINRAGHAQTAHSSQLMPCVDIFSLLSSRSYFSTGCTELYDNKASLDSWGDSKPLCSFQLPPLALSDPVDTALAKPRPTTRTGAPAFEPTSFDIGTQAKDDTTGGPYNILFELRGRFRSASDPWREDKLTKH